MSQVSGANGDNETMQSDIDAYIATLEPVEREELTLAGAAIDIAVPLYRARERRGLSQAEAAKLAGLHQQAVSRMEQPGSKPRVSTLQRYLKALGHQMNISPVDTASQEQAAPNALC